jgi:hypothetical protein
MPQQSPYVSAREHMRRLNAHDSRRKGRAVQPPPAFLQGMAPPYHLPRAAARPAALMALLDIVASPLITGSGWEPVAPGSIGDLVPAAALN